MLKRGASLTILMDELVALEEGVNAEGVLPDDTGQLVVERWRPVSIDPPCIYHDISTSPLTAPDTGTLRDTLTLLTRIAVAQDTDNKEYGRDLEVYSDCYREVIDPGLMSQGRPLNGAALWADRTDFRTTIDIFDELPYLVMEFVLQFKLDRAIPFN